MSDPVPVVCAAFCQEFSFSATTTDPFLVAIKNTLAGPNGSFNANDGFNLYLYGPSGTLVASAYGIGADGQSVEVRAPVAGAYTIVVTFTYANDADAAYVGGGAADDPGDVASGCLHAHRDRGRARMLRASRPASASRVRLDRERLASGRIHAARLPASDLGRDADFVLRG
ncbi:MAG: hypothetical protein ACXVD8_11445 [Actinomycetota bacterium]